MNEAFLGPGGLEEFEDDLDALIEDPFCLGMASVFAVRGRLALFPNTKSVGFSGEALALAPGTAFRATGVKDTPCLLTAYRAAA